MNHALVTQLVEALDKCRAWPGAHDECSAAITAAREYLATEPKQRDHPEEHLDMVGDRAELIRQLRDVLGKSVHVDIANEAADMLEADAQQAKRVPMTDKTLWEMWVESPSDVLRFARAIEAHHEIHAPK